MKFSTERVDNMKFSIFTLGSLCLSLVLLSGCSQSPSPSGSVGEKTGGAVAEKGEHRHDIGPRGGRLAVLGAHQYHAEVIPEHGAEVEFYVYDAHNHPVKLDAKELTVSTMIGEESKIFTLPVVFEGDTQQPARFKIADSTLGEILSHDHGKDIQVSLLVDGVPCNGTLAKPTGDHDH